MRGILDKFFNDQAQSPILMVRDDQAINETNSKPPEGKKRNDLDGMVKAFSSAEKDKGRPTSVSTGEVGSGRPENGMYVNDDFSGLGAGEKKVRHTVLRHCIAEGTREIRGEDRGIGMVSGKKPEPPGSHKCIMHQFKEKFQDIIWNPPRETGVCLSTESDLTLRKAPLG